MKDEDIEAVFDTMPGGARGFLKQWGYLTFARALLARKEELEAAAVKPVPFELEKAKAGHPLMTQDGRKARFVAHVPEASDGCRVIAFIEGASNVTQHYESGRVLQSGNITNHGCNLFLAPPPTRRVFVDFYKGGEAYWAGDAVDRNPRHNAIAARIPVDIPVEGK